MGANNMATNALQGNWVADEQEHPIHPPPPFSPDSVVGVRDERKNRQPGSPVGNQPAGVGGRHPEAVRRWDRLSEGSRRREAPRAAVSSSMP